MFLMPLHMVQISKVKYFGFCYLLLDLWVDLRSICLLMVALIFICWPTFHILKSNPPIYNKKHLILGDTTSDTLKVILCHIFSSQANFKNRDTWKVPWLLHVSTYTAHTCTTIKKKTRKEEGNIDHVNPICV